MVEIQLESMNMATTKVSLIHLANNTLLKILDTNVEPLIFAETAHGHPLM